MIELKGLVPGTAEAIKLDLRGEDKALPELYANGQVVDCKCGKTAMRVKHTPNIYHCLACKHSFYLEA